jgi:DMSO/TMAO reductase YedYZ molybdopterin-dependent catalytic subunit
MRIGVLNSAVVKSDAAEVFLPYRKCTEQERLMRDHDMQPSRLTRRRVLGGMGVASLALISSAASAQETVDLHVPGGPSTRVITTTYPQKGPMILQRSSPPWLETPFEVFDKGVFTPNDQHYVSWHWANFPGDINVDSFRLTVHGQVNQILSLSLKDILQGLPRFDIAAVNQCAGNSRIYAVPRVAGAQWANGSMSNAIWTGVSLRDVLDRAGVKPSAIQVRFGGLDEPVMPGAPKFLKSLSIDHARDGEVMIAFAMNGEQLPLLNGFPLRLVVPGWCGVYWVKMLNDIEVLDQPDTNYWTATGYRVPDTPNNAVKPGETGFKMVPVTRNAPRSFITNIRNGDSVPVGMPALARGIAFGGDCGVARVDLSLDGGTTWQPTQLGADQGTYGFRQWQTRFILPARGAQTLMVRCTNTRNEAQPDFLIWNPAGYLFNTIETTHVVVA